MISTALIAVIVVVCFLVCAAGGLVAWRFLRGQRAETGEELIDPEKAFGPARKVQVRRGRVVSWVSVNKSAARGITRGITPKPSDSRRTSTVSLPRTIDIEAELKALQESSPYRQARETDRFESQSDVDELPSPKDVRLPAESHSARLLSSIDESDDPADMIKELSWATYNAHRPSNHALSSVIGSVTPALEGALSPDLPVSHQVTAGLSSSARHGSDSVIPASTRSFTSQGLHTHDAYSYARSRSEGDTGIKKLPLLKPLQTMNLGNHFDEPPSSAGATSVGPASPSYAPSIQSAIYKSPVQDLIPAAPRPRKPSKLDLRGSFSRIDYNIPSPVTVSSIASPLSPGGASILSNQATLGVSTPRASRFSLASSRNQPTESIDEDTSRRRARSRSTHANSISSRSTSRSRSRKSKAQTTSSYRVCKRPPPLTIATNLGQSQDAGYNTDGDLQESGLFTCVFPSPPATEPSTPDSTVLTALPEIRDEISVSPLFAVTPTFRVPLYTTEGRGPPPIKSLNKLRNGSAGAELVRRGSDGDVVYKPRKIVREKTNPSVLRTFSTPSTEPLRSEWPPASISSMLAEAHGMAQSIDPITSALPKNLADDKSPAAKPQQLRPALKATQSVSGIGALDVSSGHRKSSGKTRSGKLLRSLSSSFINSDISPTQDETSPKTMQRPILKTSFSSHKALPSLPSAPLSTPAGVQRIEVSSLRVEHPDAPLGRNVNSLPTDFSRVLTQSVSVALKSPNWNSQAKAHGDKRTRAGSGRDTIGNIKVSTARVPAKTQRASLGMIAGAIVADESKSGMPTVTSREVLSSRDSHDSSDSTSPLVSSVNTPDIKALSYDTSPRKIIQARRWESTSSVSPISAEFPTFVQV